MIIGRQFAWAHLPKTGGDATYELFKLFPELIIFAHPRETNNKHDVFAAHKQELSGKLLAMNVRRLPSWMLSMSQHQAHYGLHPDHEHPPLNSELMSTSSAADNALRSFIDNGNFPVDLWIRTEYLIDDFLKMVSRFTEIHQDKIEAIRGMKRVNQMSYNHQLDRWFTPKQLERIYEANPLWASVEHELYGDLLTSTHALKAAHECIPPELRRDRRIQVTRAWKKTLAKSDIIGFQLDTPSQGWGSDGCILPVRGWIVSQREGPIAIEARLNGKLVKTCTADQIRTDVAQRFHNTPSAVCSGFAMQLGLMGLPTKCKLALTAVYDGEERISLSVLEIRRTFEPDGRSDMLQPLMITTGGRSGSSWLMAMLAQHRRIVIRPPHPYETRAGAYWFHMVKVLSDPADHIHSTARNTFASRVNWIGHHPFFTPQVTLDAQLGEWFQKSYPEVLADMARHSINEFYQRVATSLEKESPVYFAEKSGADHVPWLAWELYSRTREIFLVRDFRDTVASIFAFTDKNNNRGFGREKATSKQDYIERMRGAVLEFVRSWELRSDRALLIRYEDLVIETEPVLEQIMEYLGLEANVAVLVAEAAQKSQKVASHRTALNPAASIGRWKDDLDQSLQEACEHAFREALTAFGYE